MSWSKTYQGDGPVRLNKWLAQEGVCSRREAEALIARGQVHVGNEKVAEPGHKINPGETIQLNERATEALGEQITAVVHKPVGYVSAQPEGKQVPAARLLKKAALVGKASKLPSGATSLAPLGRLDQDSRGLLLLSEDGVLAKAIIGPHSLLEKEYLVRVRGELTELKMKKLRHGLELDGRMLRPAKVTRVQGQLLRFVLVEGRKRQIRRMCQLVELDVVDLLRVRIGSLHIGDLPEGKWRTLSDKERTALIKAAQPKEDTRKPNRPPVSKPFGSERQKPHRAPPRGQTSRPSKPRRSN